MVLYQHGGSVVGVDLADVQNLIHNHVTGLQFILTLYLSLGHIASAGDILVEIIGVCGSDVRNVTPGLCECGGIGRVGMHHALNIWECPVQNQVSRGVR